MIVFLLCAQVLLGFEGMYLMQSHPFIGVPMCLVAGIVIGVRDHAIADRAVSE